MYNQIAVFENEQDAKLFWDKFGPKKFKHEIGLVRLGCSSNVGHQIGIYQDAEEYNISEGFTAVVDASNTLREKARRIASGTVNVSDVLRGITSLPFIKKGVVS